MSSSPTHRIPIVLASAVLLELSYKLPLPRYGDCLDINKKLDTIECEGGKWTYTFNGNDFDPYGDGVGYSEDHWWRDIPGVTGVGVRWICQRDDSGGDNTAVEEGAKSVRPFLVK